MHVPITLPLVGPLQGNLPHPDFSAEAYLATRIFAPRTSPTFTVGDTQQELASRVFFPHSPTLPMRAGTNITITADGTITTTAPDDATEVLAGRTFAPHVPLVPPTPIDDSALIIAGNAYGSHVPMLVVPPPNDVQAILAMLVHTSYSPPLTGLEFFRLAGVKGGQIANGGTAAGDNLTLLPNSAAVPTGTAWTTRGRILGEQFVGMGVQSSYTTSSQALYPFHNMSTTTLNLTGGATYAGVFDELTLALSGASSPQDGPFGFVTKKTISLANTINYPYGGFSDEDLTTVATGKTVTLKQDGGMFRDWVQYFRAGTGNYAGIHSGFLSKPGIDSGVVIPEVDSFIAMAPSGVGASTGTVTQWVAFTVDEPAGSLTGNPVATQTNTGISFRSYSPIVQMRHGGPAVFKTTFTAFEPDGPTNTSCGLELQGTTSAFLPSRLTNTQRDALTAVEGMQLENTSAKWTEHYDGTAWRGSSPVQSYTWGTVTVPDGYGAVVADQWTITGSDMVTLQGTACIVVA